MASDEELLYAWRKGDDKAGEELFERYFVSVDRFFVNSLGEDPSDLVQTTFEACVRGRDRIGASFRAYLFAIAYNVLRRHLRDRYRCREDELPSRSLHDIAPGLGTLMEGAEEVRLLARALRRLSLELQVMLVLHYWEGMTSAEIGEMLGGVPPSTVRTRLGEARRQLVEVIAGMEASPEITRSTTDDLDAWVQKLRALLAKGRT